MKIYKRKRVEMNRQARMHTRTHNTHTCIKSKKRPDRDSNSHSRKEILVPY